MKITVTEEMRQCISKVREYDALLSREGYQARSWEYSDWNRWRRAYAERLADLVAAAIEAQEKENTCAE